jgi:hypothetical protein
MCSAVCCCCCCLLGVDAVLVLVSADAARAGGVALACLLVCAEAATGADTARDGEMSTGEILLLSG